MASTPHSYILLLVIATYLSIFLDDLGVEGTNQPPSDNTIEGQGSSFFYQKPEYPRDCSEVRDSYSSSVPSGVYPIKPDGYEEPFEAYCVNETDSGGWTVILRRFEGSVDFSRQWSDYKKGFGFLSTEFWLGSDKLSYLTNQALYEIRIDITLENVTICDLKYDAFRISDEWSDYTISSVGTYESDTACRWKEGSECDTPEGCDPGDVSTNFRDCTDVYNAGSTQDGVYYIRPAGWNDPPFKVFCNMSIEGGNWTVFQRSVNGSTNFYRNWTEYKEGFGDIQHEFWLGNEKLHYLTKQATYEYRIDFVEQSLTSYHNKYSNFRVASEDNKYSLVVGTRTGTAASSLFNIQDTPFSTYDQDNDGQNFNCAEGHRSGWWHGAYFFTYSSSCCNCFQSGSTYVYCNSANPNGDYNGGVGQNIYNNNCNNKYTEMKVRRVS